MTLVLVLMLPVVAAAGQDGKSRLGPETRAWMELQKSGNASLGALRPMSGEVADKVYERYVNSFSHAIPETFERERFVRGGGSR